VEKVASAKVFALELCQWAMEHAVGTRWRLCNTHDAAQRDRDVQPPWKVPRYTRALIAYNIAVTGSSFCDSVITWMYVHVRRQCKVSPS
jgi:hypothetical protein